MVAAPALAGSSFDIQLGPDDNQCHLLAVPVSNGYFLSHDMADCITDSQTNWSSALASEKTNVASEEANVAYVVEKFNDAQDANDALSADNTELRGKVADRNETIAEQHKLIEDKLAEIAALNQQIEGLNDQITELGKEKATLVSERDQAISNSDAAATDAAHWQAAAEALQTYWTAYWTCTYTDYSCKATNHTAADAVVLNIYGGTVTGYGDATTYEERY